MKTTYANIKDIIDGSITCPLNPEIIPNFMGINLCSVEGISWTKQDDEQLTQLTIHFIPSKGV